jgi:hypothetical protein
VGRGGDPAGAGTWSNGRVLVSRRPCRPAGSPGRGPWPGLGLESGRGDARGEGTDGFWNSVEEGPATGAATARGRRQGPSDQRGGAGRAVARCAQLGGLRARGHRACASGGRDVRAGP